MKVFNIVLNKNQINEMWYKWTASHQGLAHPQVADGGDYL
jgi:hypothetical protein